MAETDETTRALRAVAHPLRLQLLSLLTGTELSAVEVARELGITHANASYHLRVLYDAGLLDIASEERIRGGVAKRYRHPWQQHTRRGRSTAQDRNLYARAMAEELVRRVRQVEPSRPGSYTDAQLWVTPEEFEAARDAVNQAGAILHSGARPPRSEGTVLAGFTAALFQMRADSAPDRS